MSVDSHSLKRRNLVAELLMMLCGVFALAWIGPALVLVWRDSSMRPAPQILWHLWPLVPVALVRLVLHGGDGKCHITIAVSA